MAGMPLLVVLALLTAAACTSRPPVHDRSGETHYNRREMPVSPGVFTGKTGEWTARPPGAEPGDGVTTDKECQGRDPAQCDSAQRH
jgi:hypothetical protein